MRNCSNKISNLNVNSKENGEYLYACKFFSSSNNANLAAVATDTDQSNKTRVKNLANQSSYSTVLACGSGSKSLHLLDYEEAYNKQHVSSLNCDSPLYCLDTIYSSSLIACGGMNSFYTILATSSQSNK
jgi:hypothetical protein